MLNVPSVVRIELHRQLRLDHQPTQLSRRQVAREVDINGRIHRQAREEHARRRGPQDVCVRLPSPFGLREDAWGVGTSG